MSEDRKKPGVAFWATVVVVVALVGYPLSYGPVIWLANHGLLGELDADADGVWDGGWIYAPLDELPEPFSSALEWYGSLWE